MISIRANWPSVEHNNGTVIVGSRYRRYHFISRIAGQAWLLVDGADLGNTSGIGDRKLWIECRLKKLDSIFAVSVGGFSVMDNHLHMLLRLVTDA